MVRFSLGIQTGAAAIRTINYSGDALHKSPLYLTMRRLLAITLLVALGIPSALPLFAATGDSQKSLPACCRRHGVHHCSMGQVPGSGPAFTSTPCPFYPAATTAVRIAGAFISASQLTAVELFHARIAPPLAAHGAWTFTSSANLQRGPPAVA